jgi:flagellar basal-body rod modification protein FlgD
MNVNLNTTVAQTKTAATDSASKASVDYDSFLRLLVAEMKNQDPTNPMDSTQYVAQLAAFSQVEQSVQINSKLDQLLQSSTLAQADSIIGRQITSGDKTITGVVTEVRVFSDGIIAVLDNGKELIVGPGVTIGAPKGSEEA